MYVVKFHDMFYLIRKHNNLHDMCVCVSLSMSLCYISPMIDFVTQLIRIEPKGQYVVLKIMRAPTEI